MIGQEILGAVDYKVVELTSADAKELLKKNKKNRKCSETKVREYARAMADGKWQLNGQTITFSTEDVLLDGQHRLMALARQEDGVKVSAILGFGLDPKAFDTIDIGKRRSPADLLSLYDVDARFTATLSASAKLHHNYLERIRINEARNNHKIKNKGKKIGKGYEKIPKFNKVVLQNKDIYDFINNEDHSDLYKEFSEEVFKNKENIMLSPSETLFIAVILVKLNEEKGRLFSKQIITRVGIEENSPIHVLQGRLSLGQGRANRSGLTSPERIACTIQAWNYFVSEKVMSASSLNKNKIDVIKNEIVANPN